MKIAKSLWYAFIIATYFHATQCWKPIEIIKESIGDWDPIALTSIGIAKQILNTTSIFGITYRLVTPVNFEPTLNNLNTYTFKPFPESTPGYNSHISQAINMRAFIKHLKSGLPPKKNILTVKQKLHNKKSNQKKSPEQKSSEQTSPKQNQSRAIGYHTIEQGVPKNCNRVALFSRGHKFWTHERVGGGILDTYTHIRESVIPQIPTIAFDYPDERRSLNIGQRLDQECLKLVYDAIVAQNPKTKITLFGLCKGSFNNLKFLADNPENNVDTVILHSTFASAKTLVEMRTKTILGSAAIQPVGQAVKWCLPNYDETKDDLLVKAHTIMDKKILIGHLINDPFVCTQDLNNLIKALRKNNEVYLIILDQDDFEHDKGSHGKLHLSHKFQCAVNAFLSECGIEHDATLAQKGDQYLDTAAVALA